MKMKNLLYVYQIYKILKIFNSLNKSLVFIKFFINNLIKSKYNEIHKFKFKMAEIEKCEDINLN